jgi:PAS domain S-box-containing protein
MVPGGRAGMTSGAPHPDSSRAPVPPVRGASANGSARVPDGALRAAIEAYHRHSPLAAIEWCPDRTVRSWNPAAERIFGYAAAELEGVDVFPLIVHEDSRPHVDRIWAALLADTGGRASINTNVTKAGRVIQCRWHNAPLKDESGRVVGVTSFVEDITDRVRAHRAAIETNERLQRVIEKLPVIVWALDEEFRPLLWNEHAEIVTGYKASEIIGHADFLSVVHDEAEKARFLRLWEDLNFGDFDEIELATACADGAVRRILLSNIAARCPIPGWSAWGIGLDVTDRFRAFEALRQSEQQFRDIMQSVDLAGLVVNKQGRVTFCNEAFNRLSHLAGAEVLGRDWAELVGAHVGSAPVIPVGGTSEEVAFPTRLEGVLTTADGEERTLTWTRSLLRGADGEVSGAVALGLDVTDHRRAESELAAYRDQLEELVEQRTAALAESERRLHDAERLSSLGRVAAGLNHDLGNVLLPVRCHLDTLIAADLDERCREAVQAVAHGFGLLEHLGEGLGLVGATSDPSRAAQARSVALLDPHDWWADARALLERVVPPGVAFDARLDDDMPSVRVPPHHLTRAVMNLLVNSVEALSGDAPGGGRVAFRAGVDPGSGHAEFRVEDNGSGVPDDVRRRAAEPFYSTKPRSLSTGLGLSIVNAIASMAGGAFEIGNRPGGGAAAVIRLPSGEHEPSGAVRIALAVGDQRLRAACVEFVDMMGAVVAEPGDADALLAGPGDPAAGEGRSMVPTVRLASGATTRGIQGAVREAIRRGQGRRGQP